jgi:hypothetical protein
MRNYRELQTPILLIVIEITGREATGLWNIISLRSVLSAYQHVVFVLPQFLDLIVL